MSQEAQVVIFNIDKDKYATSIASVERIIGFSPTTPVPDTSDYVLGVIPYQDNILPVVDLNKRFYHKDTEYNQDSKILVIQLKDYKIGLLVDAVSEIKAIDEDMIQQSSGMIKGISTNYIKGMIKKDDEIIIYLEIGKIFQGEQHKELAEINQEA